MNGYKLSTTGTQRRPNGIYVGVSSKSSESEFLHSYLPLSDFGTLWNKMVASAAQRDYPKSFPEELYWDEMWGDCQSVFNARGINYNPDTTLIIGGIRFIQPKSNWGTNYSRDAVFMIRVLTNVHIRPSSKLYLSNNPTVPVNIPYNDTSVVSGYLNRNAASYAQTSTGGYPKWFYLDAYNPVAKIDNDNLAIHNEKEWDQSFNFWEDHYWASQWYQRPDDAGEWYYGRINGVNTVHYYITWRDWYQTLTNPFDNLTGYNDLSRKPTTRMPFNAVLCNIKPEVVSKIRITQ